MRATPVFVLLVAALGGCMGGDNDPGQVTREYFPAIDELDNQTANATEDLTYRVDAPVWEVGDWWTYATLDGREVTFVVTESLGGYWTVDTTDSDLAFHDARFDVDLVGTVGKNDLSTTKSRHEMVYYAFPLEDHKEWETRYGFERVDVVAKEEPDGTFTLRAVSQRTGYLYLEYTYNPDVRWFDSWRLVGTDGSDAARYDLKDHGRAFSGEIVRWKLDRLYDWRYDPDVPLYYAQFHVGTESTDLWLSWRVMCDQGAVEAELVPASPALATEQAFFTFNEPCPVDAAGERSFPIVETSDGQMEWIFSVQHYTPVVTQGYYQFLLLERTLQFIPVG